MKNDSKQWMGYLNLIKNTEDKYGRKFRDQISTTQFFFINLALDNILIVWTSSI